MIGTKADREALEKLPDKIWFTADDVCLKIRRPSYRLTRLFLQGCLLGKKVIVEYENGLKDIIYKYKKP